jgi:hypothetical protein
MSILEQRRISRAQAVQCDKAAGDEKTWPRAGRAEESPALRPGHFGGEGLVLGGQAPLQLLAHMAKSWQ